MGEEQLSLFCCEIEFLESWKSANSTSLEVCVAQLSLVSWHFVQEVPRTSVLGKRAPKLSRKEQSQFQRGRFDRTDNLCAVLDISRTTFLGQAHLLALSQC